MNPLRGPTLVPPLQRAPEPSVWRQRWLSLRRALTAMAIGALLAALIVGEALLGGWQPNDWLPGLNVLSPNEMAGYGTALMVLAGVGLLAVLAVWEGA